MAHFRVHRHVQLADLATAEGKDRLVSELRDVFAGIPSSAVREELIGLVADKLELEPTLVTSWVPTPDRSTDGRQANLAKRCRSAGAPGTSTQCTLLVRCLADPREAAALPFGSALENLFPDALAYRAAEHIRVHAADPVADLPSDDHELVSFITSLLTISGVCR
jgi:DNA primase